MMEMPRPMNGVLKSITRSRSDVIVSGAIAMSASCLRKYKQTIRFQNQQFNFRGEIKRRV